jgi:phosphomannomutase
MSRDLSCFKAYDLRGRVPDQLNEALARDIGRAYAAYIQPGTAVVGHDIRLSSKALVAALSEGLMDGGVDVSDIGQCGTEEIYFATDHLGVGGGIMVTASHNPEDYNGMKFVREGARPISGDTGLTEIRDLLARGDIPLASERGHMENADVSEAYVERLLGYVNVKDLRPLKIVANAGNGGAGAVIDRLEAHLPFEFVKVHHDADGAFPNGVPNPLLPENRPSTIDAIRTTGADIGIAWDGDFDRCFFIDENGSFVEGYYIVGLLAEAILKINSGAKIVHDPRLTWNTREIVTSLGGTPVQSKTGHAFIKERMRLEDAAYGGEMSAHHYFRDFAYCDSGMIPWLLVAGIMSSTGKPLSELISDRIERFPVSGEINRRLQNPARALELIRERYEPDALFVDETDGLSFEFAEWRFNLRLSNTEPVIRLNVETRADRPLLDQRTAGILELLDAL